MSSCSAGLTKDPQPPRWLEGPHGPLAFYPFPGRNPWLHVVLSHGFSEHAGWWHHVGRALAARGVSAYAFDHYHHGRSAGTPGDVPDYGALLDGLRTALVQGVGPQREAQPAPLVVLGHSNGALVTLLAGEALDAWGVDGLVLASPFLAMRPWVALGGTPLAWLLATVSPRLRVPLGVRPQRLSHNRAIWPDYHRDPLRFRVISARFFLAMRRAAARGRRVASLGERPLLVLAAGDERVVSARAMAAWYARVASPDKQWRGYPDHRHELFQETAWQGILDDVIAWCGARFRPGGHASK